MPSAYQWIPLTTAADTRQRTNSFCTQYRGHSKNCKICDFSGSLSSLSAEQSVFPWKLHGPLNAYWKFSLMSSCKFCCELWSYRISMIQTDLSHNGTCRYYNNLTWVWDADRKFRPEGHCLASWGFVEWCKTLIQRVGIFYPHRTVMFDSFSCIPFDFECFILEVIFITTHNDVELGHF